MNKWAIGVASLGLMFVQCGGDDSPPAQQQPQGCSIEAQTGCGAGLVCEEVQGGTPACYKPLQIAGKVVDMTTSGPVASAHVVARDANDTALSHVAVTAADGTYNLTVPAKRDSTGKVLATAYTLRADAAGFLTFPLPPRVALPVDVSSASGDPLVASSIATDIALIPIQSSTGLGSVSGKVKASIPGGTLVVAGGRTGVADSSGDFTVFNVPAGQVQVNAYSAGLQFDPVTVQVSGAAETKDVVLTANGKPTATVSGQVQIVNGGGASGTSVVLALEETFDQTTLRGEVPKGLRVSKVTGAFSIPGVPDGKYVVLAAFENDGLVRDPDTSIGGTEIVHITIAGGASQPLSQGFKVTGALAVISPGADGIDEVSGTPTFKWKDDSSEDGYEVFVFDALGNQMTKLTVPAFKGDDPSVAYSGGALVPGMLYQFRAVSMKSSVPISSTEDLKGVFIYR